MSLLNFYDTYYAIGFAIIKISLDFIYNLNSKLFSFQVDHL